MLKKNYWKERQKKYLEVFENSLPGLQVLTKAKTYDNEDDISRALCFAVQDTVFCSKYEDLGLPTFQVYAQPISADKVKVKREDKCPDFLWTYVDYVNKQRRDFYVECKRLRKDSTVHSREYVLNGLKRFVEKEWSYGFGCNYGLMIGYVEGIPISEFIDKVSKYLTQQKMSSLALVLASASGDIECHTHKLHRKGIPFTPIDVYHYLVVIS
ncbi:MAG: hypothetical protein JWN78_1963 [Bacteroidota bacterium]|nr:hypothetical protein [Bacteroidota bacterium]